MSFAGCFDPAHRTIDDDGRWVYGCSRCGMCYGCAHYVVEDTQGRRIWRCGDGKLRAAIRDAGFVVGRRGGKAWLHDG